MRDVFTSTGVRDVGEEEVTTTMVHTTPVLYWAFMTDIAAPVVAGLAKADAPTQERIKAEVLDLAVASIRDGAVWMLYTAIVITGTR
jgi:hypothetical protein